MTRKSVPSPSPIQFVGPTIVIQEPRAFGIRTKVRVHPGTGQPNNTLSPYGTATATAGPLDGVWGQVIGLNVVPNPTHPAGAKPGSIDTIGNWWFRGGPAYEIPGRTCQASPTDNNGQLAIWCHFNDGSPSGLEGVKSTLFAGVCSTITNCDGSGSGGTYGGSGGGGGEWRPVTTAPAKWCVQGRGFTTRTTQPFNGEFLIALRPGTVGACVWDNCGDGAETPLVELRCQSPLTRCWQLILRLGRCELQYSKSAVEWHDLGQNVFHLLASQKGHRGQLPASLTLIPA